jgi:hypothetical protein
MQEQKVSPASADEPSQNRSFLATKGGLGAFESDAIEKGEIRRAGLSFLKNRFSLV